MTTLLVVALLGQYQDQITIAFARTTAKAPPLPINAKSTFTVTFFNGTKKPVSLLNENNSWGYEMVSFEVKNPAGALTEITRIQHGWDKNAPTPVIVQSVDMIHRKISFGDGTWQGFPAGIGGQKDGWQVRMKLTLRPEKALTEAGIWTGSITSKWTPATLN